MTALPADRTVASFDSATALHAAVAAALAGRSFAHLGQSAAAARATRVAGRLPWPLLRPVYSRIGAAESVRPDQLAEVDLESVAGWLTGRLPQRRFPAVLLGSSNGAMAHLAAAMQIPWLPGTLLVPVRRRGDPARPDEALRFGERHAPALLRANPGVRLHQMQDQIQDRLMVAEMAYFRVKWQRLPEAYARWLTAALQPRAPVIILEDSSDWPVVQVSDRHVFQPGAQGGVDPETYAAEAHTPTPDDTAPEAEWGADPDFTAAVAAWCADHDHPLVRVSYRGPQAPAHAVATMLRTWHRDRGEPADRLVVPSFILVDPWRMINTASVPFWAFFSVQPAVAALDDHLRRSDPYREVAVIPFQHGADSAGIARPEDWAAVITGHGAEPSFPGLRRAAFPHDIGYLGRYGTALRRLPAARHPWRPYLVGSAVAGLRAAGLISSEPAGERPAGPGAG